MSLPEETRQGLRDILAFSLKATAWGAETFAQEETAPARNRSTRFSRIVEGILFSRRFILSYQLVLVGLLIVFTIRHWTYWLRRRNRRSRTYNGSRAKNGGLQGITDGRIRNANPARGGESRTSSSSSTVIGSPPSPKSSSHERTPLLAPSKAAKRRWQLVYSIRSFLVYQPRPIPLINKTLPSNGTTLAILAFLGLQIFYVFYRTPLSVPMLFIFADRTSLLFVANLPLLYLFAAKNQPIKLLTGYSYESLNVFHRRIGEVMCFLALLHSVEMIGVWYTILRPTGFSLARFLLSKTIVLGIGALVAYELIYFTSLGSFRQRWYELFLALHVSLQVLAVVLVWFHHQNSRPYVGAALAIFLIDRLVYRMALKIHSSRAWLEVCKDRDTVVVRTTIILTQKRRFLTYLVGGGITKGWRPTEHVFLTVPSLSKKHVIQAHPFTIASKAPHPNDAVAQLKLIIRAQNGFSGDLVRYAKGHSSVNVRIDGPYGSQNALHLLQQCDLAVIVAGGSGIAVALPLVWALHTSRSSIDLEGATIKKSLTRIVLIWVTRHKSHCTWVDSTELQILQDDGIEVIVPPPTVEHAHPDIPGIMQSWISTHDDTLFNGEAKTGVICSGPDGMNRAVRNTCSSLLAQGRDVDIEIEKFGW
ncbi:MAG: hypothetical protein Q9225_006482 [Loekoesia sp. 1 TL-2023]